LQPILQNKEPVNGNAAFMSDSFSNELVSRYAKALFDLAREQDSLGQAEKEVLTLQTLLSTSEDALRMLNNPLLSRAEQAQAVSAILKHIGITQLVKNFCLVLAENRRLPLLPAVIDQFLTLLSENRGEITAEVISAIALQEQQLTAIKSSLKESLRHDIRLKSSVDASILGGLIVKIGSTMVDDSLASKLERLKLLSINAVSAL
jgi:F-type H+-transporting ATPase subunit delta